MTKHTNTLNAIFKELYTDDYLGTFFPHPLHTIGCKKDCHYYIHYKNMDLMNYLNIKLAKNINLPKENGT